MTGVASGAGHHEPSPAGVVEGGVELLDPQVVGVVIAGGNRRGTAVPHKLLNGMIGYPRGALSIGA